MPLSRISAGQSGPFAAGPGYGSQAPQASGPQSPTPQVRPRVRRRRSWRGLGIAAIALAIAAGIAFAPAIPSLNGAGAGWTSFLPWTAVLLVLLAGLAVVRRAWWGLSAVLVSAMVWSAVFVPQLMPAQVPAGAPDLTVATQNIGAANTNPVAATSALAATGAGIVAVQEIVGTDDAATAVLDDAYRYNARVSTVGLWSQWSMEEPEPLELGLSWARAMRVVVHYPDADIAVYAVHLPSVRPGDTDARDQAIAELTALVAADPESRVIVLGDLNTATTDPALNPLTAVLADSRETVKGGFGFSWPGEFPMTRPDHVLGRGVTAVADQVLTAGGSDHRAVLVGLDVR